jgi:hypothetical protein
MLDLQPAATRSRSRRRFGLAYERRYPRTDMLLIEPARGDEEPFFKNVFSHADREATVRVGLTA